jgi:hypothetical protein
MNRTKVDTMKTCRTFRMIRAWLLALVVSIVAAPTPAETASPAKAPEVAPPAHFSMAAVLPAAWYDELFSSRTRTIQAVFVLVLIGAFMLRKSS